MFKTPKLIIPLCPNTKTYAHAKGLNNRLYEFKSIFPRPLYGGTLPGLNSKIKVIVLLQVKKDIVLISYKARRLTTCLSENIKLLKTGAIVTRANENAYMCTSLNGCKLENRTKTSTKAGSNLTWKQQLITLVFNGAGNSHRKRSFSSIHGSTS